MKVGRFGLGFKSVFHMTGKVKYFPRKPKISLVVTISGPEMVKESSDQSSATSALRETTQAPRQLDEVVLCAINSRLTKLSCQINQGKATMVEERVAVNSLYRKKKQDLEKAAGET